jgi:indolepyruvate ferredoxin oxidoreductase beta subunit
VTDDLHFIPSLHRAEEAGNTRAHNMVMLGALSSRITEVAPETWLEVIAELAPKKTIEVNQRAFQMGREIGQT